MSNTYSGSNTLLLSLQQDTGRWCTEYTWDSEGNIWGIQVLRNFGRVDSEDISIPFNDNDRSAKRVDEEEIQEGGLRGRISAGAELYVGSKKSAGG